MRLSLKDLIDSARRNLLGGPAEHARLSAAVLQAQLDGAARMRSARVAHERELRRQGVAHARALARMRARGL